MNDVGNRVDNHDVKRAEEDRAHAACLWPLAGRIALVLLRYIED